MGNCMKKNYWKILIIALIIMPCMFIFNGCSCDGNIDDGSGLRHNVMFYTDSAETGNYPSLVVKDGDLCQEPKEPTKTGYLFTGWYRDREHNVRWVFSEDRVTETITLYAGWSEVTIIES